MCRSLLDDVILLDEEEIAAGIHHAARLESEIIEGAAAVGIALRLLEKSSRQDQPPSLFLVAISIPNNIAQSWKTAIGGQADG